MEVDRLISHRLGRAAVWLLLIAAVVYSVDQFFFPIIQYHYDDEWFVLPERVWYRDGFAWFKHLLFFSQTRTTWVGDFMLVRPGLFSWIWLQDMLVRSDRMGQQFLMIGVAAFAFAVFYFNVYREAGAWLAVAGCLYAFTCLVGTDLYTWPHINGYVFAMALYTLGVSVLLSPKLTVTRGILCAALFIKGEIFHEFVPLAVAALIFVEWFLWRKKDRANSNARLLVLFGALGAYAVVVAIAYLFLRPPGVFSPGEAEAVILNWNYLVHVLQVQLGFFLGVINDLTPFYLFNPALNWLRIGFGCAAVVFGIWFYSQRYGVENRKVTACVVALLVMFVGLLLGRTATRGVIKVHYYPMIQYFLVMAGILLSARFLRARPRWYLSVTLVLVASSVWSATLIGRMNQAREDIVDVTSVAAVSLKEYLREHDTSCFAGVFDPYFRSRLNASLNIAFLLDSCGSRVGKPVYFRAASDGALSEYSPAAMRGTWLPLRAGLANDDLGIANYLRGPQYNIHEAEQNLRHNGVLKIHPVYGDMVARALSVKYESVDEFPSLWNVGVKISGGGTERYFLLWNNMLRVVLRSSSGELQEEAAVSMIDMKPSSELRISQSGDACLVFWGDHLMTQLKSCLVGPVRVGLFSFVNATPEERLIGASYLPDKP